MNEKKYEFTGIDAKTELMLALWTVLILILVCVGFGYIYNVLFVVEDIPTQVIVEGIFLGLAISLFFLRVLSLKYRDIWEINDSTNSIQLKFKTKIWILKKNEIIQINNYGNVSFRYCTLRTKDEKIKIRVGYGSFTPFSTVEDLSVLESLVKDLKPFLSKHFINKDNITGYKTLMFDNQGTYKRK